MKPTDIKGLLFTAGAVALGVIVASMVQTKLLKGGAGATASEDEE